MAAFTIAAMKTSNTTPPRPSHRARRAVAAVLLAVLVVTGCSSGDTRTSTATSGSTAVTTEESTAVTTEESSSTATGQDTDATTTAGTITDTAAAAQAFLDTLSEEQRDAIVYAYDDETKTTSWSNFPVTFVDRAGLNLTELTEEQRAAAMDVLAALLSDEGYETVTGIMAGDQFLLDNSPTAESSFGQYYIAVFGDPSDTSAWTLQFGGHHLGINTTLDGSDPSITFAPTHLGSQPAVYTDADGNEVQPLAGVYESAFAFYDSLTDEQLAEMYQGEDVADLACAPGGTCSFPTGTGLAGSDLTDEQKQLLLAVVANWVGLSDEETTSDALAAIEATLDDTYVNWSGATEYDMTTGAGIHLQVSGPKVYVEVASQPTSAGSEVEGYVTAGWGHIHTIYRDPTNDYAGSTTQQASAGPGGNGGAGSPGERGGNAPR